MMTTDNEVQTRAHSSMASPGTKLTRQTFPVLEMTCAACAVSVESMLGNPSGVSKAAVNYANQSAMVEYDARLNSPAGMRQVLQSIGYDLVVDIEGTL